ncbi:uncharacterized protein LOC122537879 [Frieseomelitta varia]|uniref:uncharacterized protein LOC122537879 n=1 Tax=Frieseomelitta varia TaxID=561572 RepID=UPI001CB68BDE|nr:uncharacterized protein LOC122537879 [Frieseomelitta varia]
MSECADCYLNARVDSLLFFLFYIFSFSTFVFDILVSVLKRIRPLQEIKITLLSINFLIYFGEIQRGSKAKNILYSFEFPLSSKNLTMFQRLKINFSRCALLLWDSQ